MSFRLLLHENGHDQRHIVSGGLVLQARHVLQDSVLNKYMLIEMNCRLHQHFKEDDLGQGVEKPWSYFGSDGPLHWGDMYNECKLPGASQTPRNITSHQYPLAQVIPSPPMPVAFTVKNNGHAVQADVVSGDTGFTHNGEFFKLVQFHYHAPSEHFLEGKQFDLEVHYVHKSAAGKFAVLGYFFRMGGVPNGQVGQVLAAVGRGSVTLELRYPNLGAFRTYVGSLTTPPCSGNILWLVNTVPLVVSALQLDAFVAQVEFNARPLQHW